MVLLSIDEGKGEKMFRLIVALLAISMEVNCFAQRITSTSLENTTVYFQTETIDFTQVQLIPLLITDSTQRFIVREVIAQCDDYVGVTFPTISGSWGWTEPNYDDLGYSTMSLYSLDDCYRYSSGFSSTIPAVPPSTQLYFNMTTSGQATSFKGKLLVVGMYI